MEAKTFREFCDIAYNKAGIKLRDGKQALVSARVHKRLRVLELADEKAYLDFLNSIDGQEELIHFLDVISTNFTSFFRESDHFDTLGEETRRIRDHGVREFKVWSAACSSGEEPYTIAMVLADVLGETKTPFRILATDISTRILQRAKQGAYPEEIVSKIPGIYRGAWMTRITRRNDDLQVFRVKDELKEHISFARLNLSKPPFPMQGPFEFIFCRNVMIYFDNAVRQRLVAEMERLLRPGGLLMIGHTETLTGLRTLLRAERPSVYRKPGAF